jgi:epoxyqueuosine reductase
MEGENVGLAAELERFARQRGADLFGIADLGPARELIPSQGPSLVNGFPRAVSMGKQLCDIIVDHHDPNEPRRQSLYWHHVYEVVTRSLDFLAYDAARWLSERGFPALPVPASTPYDFDRLEGIFSHKLAAHLAGVGWIGKSCLLLTDQFGPRVRFVSVLTDAPLETGSARDRPCGKCRLCVDACPVKAFTGVEFHPEEGREVRFDAFKCSEFRREHPCGLCVSSCPRGRARHPRGEYLSR